MKLSYSLLKEISKKYGDSFYLLYVDKFKRNYMDFLKSFSTIYPKTKIAYSYKTNYIPFLCKMVDKLGGFAEVVSEMEYDLAIKIGINPNNIIVNGPYKPKMALRKFLLDGSLVNIDSYREFRDIVDLAKIYKNNKFRIGLRINFELRNIKYSRFGFDIEGIDIKKVIENSKVYDNIFIESIHCHFPNRDLESFIERTNKLLFFIDKIFNKKIPKFIDIGGGFAGKMNHELKKQFNYYVPSYKEYAYLIASKFKEKFNNFNEHTPTLVLEPGTAIVADTMKFICKVYTIKNVRNKYIATTSGSKFNISLLHNEINLPIKVYSNDNGSFFESIDIAGYTCIEHDYLYKGFSGYLSENDFIVFDNVGSYSIVFKPPFILPNVPVIAFDGSEMFIVKNQETLDNIFSTYVFEDK